MTGDTQSLAIAKGIIPVRCNGGSVVRVPTSKLVGTAPAVMRSPCLALVLTGAFTLTARAFKGLVLHFLRECHSEFPSLRY